MHSATAELINAAHPDTWRWSADAVHHRWGTRDDSHPLRLEQHWFQWGEQVDHPMLDTHKHRFDLTLPMLGTVAEKNVWVAHTSTEGAFEAKMSNKNPGLILCSRTGALAVPRSGDRRRGPGVARRKTIPRATRQPGTAKPEPSTRPGPMVGWVG